MPYFSLVIATINRVSHHLKLLESLENQTCKDFEIILIDQNSHDTLKSSLLEHVNNFNLIYLHVKKNMGLSAARNYGLTRASGQIVAFPDDDCWYSPDILEQVKTRFQEDPSLAGLTGLVTNEQGRFSAGGFMLKNRKVAITKKNAAMTTNSSGIFLKRAPIHNSGRFDETLGLGAARYISGEETDLVLRIISQGDKVIYDPKINIYHEVYQGKYDKKECSRRYGYGLGMGYILKKHNYNLLHLSFYSLIHLAKGTFLLITLKPCRAWSHYCQSWGRLKGWVEYSRQIEKSSEIILENTRNPEAALG